MPAMEATEIQTLIEDGIAGRRSITAIVETLLDEMGRGGRILMVDENILDVEKELSAMNYTTGRIKTGLTDELIKPMLESRVFITQNGKDFCNPDDMQHFYYGLIWVTSQGDAKMTAKKVETVLMNKGFRRNLTQCVKI